MASTKLVIRPEQANPDGYCVIYVLYTHLSQNTYFSTKEKVHRDHWDKKNQQVRKLYRGFTLLNDCINQKKFEIEEIKLSLRLKGIEPTVRAVKDTYTARYEVPEAIMEGILDYKNEYLQYKADVQQVANGTLRHIKCFFEHIERYQIHFGKMITFRMVTENFLEDLVAYYYGTLNMAPNTAGSQIKFFKSYLAWAVKKGYCQSHDFRTFSKPRSKTDIVALTKAEFELIYKHDLSANPRLERVRDLFIFGCATGLRFSDYSKIGPSNIQDSFIKVHVQKTQDIVSIPMNDYSKTILEKYNSKLPTISLQKMNEYLREVGKAVGLTRERQIAEYAGKRKSVVSKQMWELLSSHLARKTFVTLSLELGIPAKEVMKVTGHKDFKSFLRYVDSSDSQLKEQMSKWNQTSAV